MSDISGTVSAGWEGVRDAFAANFDAGREVGAAFAAYHRGEKVVDLWGGVADPTTAKPWNEDTVVLVFSSTKGATALCANILAERGELDVDAPVVRYWPEFAAAGKEQILVRHLLAHQAGLAWVDEDVSYEAALAWDPVIRALEAQAPAWEPGAEHGYHATTYGWLVGEVVRRISGMSLGAFFAHEVARPLGLDFWIGTPPEVEPRVAPLITDDFVGMFGAAAPAADPSDPEAEQARIEQISEMMMGLEIGRALMAPGRFFSSLDLDEVNRAEVHAAEFPAWNGICDARSMAKMYAAMLGPVDGVRILGEEQLGKATTQVTSGGNRLLFGMDLQFALGFMVHSELVALAGPRSFGHFGAGGSMGWADPEAGLAMGYVMNRMDIGLSGDNRTLGLAEACQAAAG